MVWIAGRRSPWAWATLVAALVGAVFLICIPGSFLWDDQQFFLEQSNVNMVSEMTDLITAQRAYEINSKVIQASDSMMGTITSLR